MRTEFLDGEDKQLFSLALEYELAGKRISWNDLARRMRGKRRPRELEQRLRALKRTYGKCLTRFPRCFFPKAATAANQPGMPPAVPRSTPLHASRAERAIQEIYSSISAAEVRQQADKTDENAGKKIQSAEYI
ncbi:hypothetical protein V7S43_005954 [Phytophthora oleae]|uniref:Myb-like domain-containing protein n=1 Tax=Phytophthora oleae TaxID=2107226 RepID=A0ABD3FP07_9STRA